VYKRQTPNIVFNTDFKMDSLIASRHGVRTFVVRYTLSKIWSWLSNDAIKPAEWNRPEVAKRKGNDSDLMASIIQGFCIGIFIGFYNGKLTGNEINPSKESPIHVTEGGHRLRWLKKILGGETAVHGFSIQDIRIKYPDLYDFIMNYKITIEFKTHTSGVMPEKYMRSEYNNVNTHSELLKPGEMRSTDDSVTVLCNVFDDAFTHRKEKTNGKIRQAGLHLKNRFIASMNSKDFRKMATTDYTLPTIADEIVCGTIEKNINLLGEIESDIIQRAPKKVKTKMTGSLDDKIHGTMFYGLIHHTDRAEDVIRKFYDMACVDDKTYTTMMDKIKKKTAGANGGDRFTNPDYFSSRWRIIDNIVNPVTHGDSEPNDSEDIN
jgi:hypothetical protein